VNRSWKQDTARAIELIMTGKQVNELNSNEEWDNGNRTEQNTQRTEENTGYTCLNNVKMKGYFLISPLTYSKHKPIDLNELMNYVLKALAYASFTSCNCTTFYIMYYEIPYTV